MNLFVKICGITNIEDAINAADYGANALGFIFYDKSPRYVHPNTAAQIIRRLPNNIEPVGVFVNHSRREILTIVENTGIKIAQLHGDEKPEETRYRDSVKIWKAIRPNKKEDLDILDSYNAEAFLIDAYDKVLYGGSGKTSDWEIAKIASAKKRIMLAGGLNAGNITRAIETVLPYGVDINSGVESQPGIKDKTKLKTIFDILNEIKNK